MSKEEYNCEKANVRQDTFVCEKIVYKFKDEFAVAVGKYRQKGDKNKLDMIAMRWLINPEKDVENNAELAKKGFPFNSDMEPVWLTVPVELVKPLKEFFEKLQEPLGVLEIPCHFQ